ncbi:MAG: hypothetical protein Q9180_008329, partial [Flavoplaca navasiana]
ELESIGTGCQEVLTQFDKILVKYNALSEQERSARRLWKKIRFGSGVVADVAELRSRVTYYISALSLFLNLVSITAHFLSTERREGSVLTAHTNDDRDAWRELRRSLVKNGFRDSLVRKHMNTIMAYVKELGDRGVLDDIHSDKADLPINPEFQEFGESSDMNQKAVPSLVLRSYVREDNPSANPKDGNQQEHLPQSEDKSSTSPSNRLGSRSKVRVALEGDSGLLSNDRASANPSKRPSKSTFTAQHYQSESLYSQDLIPDQLSFVQSIMKKVDFMKINNLRYYSSTSLVSYSNTDLIYLNELKLPHFIADDAVIHNINVPIGSNGLGLEQLLRSIRYRLISISDLHGDFTRRKYPKDPKSRRHQDSMTTEAT